MEMLRTYPGTQTAEHVGDYENYRNATLTFTKQNLAGAAFNLTAVKNPPRDETDPSSTLADETFTTGTATNETYADQNPAVSLTLGVANLVHTEVSETLNEKYLPDDEAALTTLPEASKNFEPAGETMTPAEYLAISRRVLRRVESEIDRALPNLTDDQKADYRAAKNLIASGFAIGDAYAMANWRAENFARLFELRNRICAA
jgi:hypothetical protein